MFMVDVDMKAVCSRGEPQIAFEESGRRSTWPLLVSVHACIHFLTVMRVAAVQRATEL